MPTARFTVLPDFEEHLARGAVGSVRALATGLGARVDRMVETNNHLLPCGLMVATLAVLVARLVVVAVDARRLLSRHRAQFEHED